MDFSYTDLATQMGLELDNRVVEPLITLLTLGIFEPLPQNPDSQEIYTGVHAFAVKAGVRFGEGDRPPNF